MPTLRTVPVRWEGANSPIPAPGISTLNLRLHILCRMADECGSAAGQKAALKLIRAVRMRTMHIALIYARLGKTDWRTTITVPD